MRIAGSCDNGDGVLVKLFEFENYKLFVGFFLRKIVPL